MSKWLIFLLTNNFYRLFSSRLFLYQWGIKGRPVNNDYSIDSQNFEIIDKIPKVKAGEVVGIVRYKNIFAKRCKGNSSREIFNVAKVLNINPWSYAFKNLNGEKILKIRNFFLERIVVKQIINELLFRTK